MNKHLLRHATTILVLSSVVFNSQALEAEFSAADFSINTSESQEFEIYVHYSTPIIGYQIKVTLPDCLSFEKIDGTYGVLREDCVDDTHSLVCGENPVAGALTFVAYSTMNNAFKKSDVPMLKIKVKASDDAPLGDTQILISEMELSDSNCNPIRPSDFSVNVSIKQGDINLVHGEPFSNSIQKKDVKVNYTRNFDNTQWQPLFIPFELKESDWKDKIKVAKINNVEYCDNDNDNTIDRTILDFTAMTNGDIKANTPYMIKPLQAGELVLSSENTTLAETPSKDPYTDFSTDNIIFKVNGTYQDRDLGANSFGYEKGRFAQMGSDATVNPFDIYLTVANRYPATFSYNPKEIRLSIDGDEIDEVIYDLASGWNWISSNISSISDPLDFIAPIENNVYRLLSQTQELIYDSQFKAFVGNLKEIEPDKAYKVNLTKDSELAFVETIYNPDNLSQPLYKGWNWIGYTPNEEMALSEALADLNPMVGDQIKSIGEFSTYTADGWTGSLKTLVPGEGYLYYSGQNTTFKYPAHSSANGNVAKVEARTAEYRPWTFDVHKYSDNATMIAEVMDDNAGRYIVGAFSNGECRGIGIIIEGRIFLTIHGEINDEISFRAFDESTNQEFDIKESVSFNETVIGSYNEPFLLHFNDVTSIENINNNDTLNYIYNLNGIKVSDSSNSGIYIINGKKVTKK